MSFIHEEVKDSVDYSALDSKSYIDKNNLNKEAKEWSKEHNIVLIYDPVCDGYDYEENRSSEDLQDIINKNTTYLKLLEDQWVNFNQMTHKQRRVADWELQRILGYTNYQHYVYLKDLFTKINSDIDNKTIIKEMVEDSINYDGIDYTTRDVEDAIQWSKDANAVIIVPTKTKEELDDLWYNYNNMTHKQRRVSDMVSIEIFGVTNLRHYEYLKSNMIDPEDNGFDFTTPSLDEIEESVDMISSVKPERFITTYLERYSSEPIYELAVGIDRYLYRESSDNEKRITTNTIDNIMEDRDKGRYVSSTYMPYGDMPFFDPQEMVDFGVFNPVDADNYFGVQADNTTLDLDNDFSTKKWFENYVFNFNGIPTKDGSEMAHKWLGTMRRLYSDFDTIKESGDKNRINARMQSILELGWNPYIDFNSTNRVNAVYRTEAIIESKANTYEFIDLRDTENIFADYNEDEYDDNSFMEFNTYLESITEEAEKRSLKPVFLIFIGGHTLFSDLIKGITNSKYSHAAISLDANMKDIYSFGMDALERKGGNKSGIMGGLSHEGIDKYEKGTPLSIFGFFVNEEDYANIKKNLDWFIDKANQTRYAYMNLLAYIFKIPVVRNTKMFCSEFVDRILKLSNIDISGMASSNVAPADLERGVKKNSKIYHFFEDTKEKFKARILKAKITRLYKNAKAFKEDVFVNDICYKYIQELSTGLEPITFTEARSFPLEFDKNGNLIIHGDMLNLDFDSEFSKSHKILMAADKSGNIESMKYELAKLWMMNILLEKKLHKKNIKEKDSLELNNSRARILNDFKKYLDVVMKDDPKFNFTKYYEASPFNDSAMKITGNTLKYSIETLKRLFNPKLTPIQFIR